MRSLLLLFVGPLAGVALVRLLGPLRPARTMLAAAVGQFAFQHTFAALSPAQRLWLLSWPNRQGLVGVGYLRFEPTLGQRLRGWLLLTMAAAMVAGFVLLVHHEGRGDDAAPPHDA